MGEGERDLYFRTRRVFLKALFYQIFVSFLFSVFVFWVFCHFWIFAFLISTEQWHSPNFSHMSRSNCYRDDTIVICQKMAICCFVLATHLLSAYSSKTCRHHELKKEKWVIVLSDRMNYLPGISYFFLFLNILMAEYVSNRNHRQYFVHNSLNEWIFVGARVKWWQCYFFW